MNTSIVVMTHNRKNVLEQTINGMLEQDFQGRFEIIVVNDGSTDGTKQMLWEKFRNNKKVVVLNQHRSFPCKARNNGIRKAKFEFVVIMDDDCIPSRNWLKNLIDGFNSEKIGVVSSFDLYGGTSTAFRKSVLEKIGGYDEQYRYYREDTDLVFRVLDAGYEAKLVKADFTHEHKMEAPKGLLGLVAYGLERAAYHMNDVLLYKKHPKLAKEFLGVRFGFLVSPAKDFAAATNQWFKGGKMKLASPRGIVFLEGKNFAAKALIVIGGISWVFTVKFFRLIASIRFWKLLV